MDEAGSRQLGVLAEVDESFAAAGIDYWVFGGWAVDLYAGAVTRPHDDVDIAVWLDDLPRIAGLLASAGWRHAPAEGEDGGTGYERHGVRLELMYLVRDGHAVVTPMRTFAIRWPARTFGDDTRELDGTRARVIALATLVEGKRPPRDDDADGAKDRADAEVLAGL